MLGWVKAGRRDMMTKGFRHLQDYNLVLNGHVNQMKAQSSGYEILTVSNTLSDIHLFTTMKSPLKWRYFFGLQSSFSELKTWLQTQPSDAP